MYPFLEQLEQFDIIFASYKTAVPHSPSPILPAKIYVQNFLARIQINT